MEEELEKILKATEIVVLPEGQSIEEFLTGTPKQEITDHSHRLNQISADYERIDDETNELSQELQDEDETAEDFEAFYQLSKTQIHNFEVRREIKKVVFLNKCL